MKLETFNKKAFLLPNSITSMAAAHAKIYPERKEYQLRISDCNGAIKLYGKIENDNDLHDGIDKLSNLIKIAEELRIELLKLYNNG